MQSNHTENRPLSPHLTIYRPQFTSVLSILHRITGIGLMLSFALILFWFISLALGQYWFNLINSLLESWVVKLILIFSVWAIWYHTCAGIRHLIWDAGFGLAPQYMKISAWLVIAISTFLTILTITISWIN